MQSIVSTPCSHTYLSLVCPDPDKCALLNKTMFEANGIKAADKLSADDTIAGDVVAGVYSYLEDAMRLTNMLSEYMQLNHENLYNTHLKDVRYEVAHRCRVRPSHELLIESGYDCIALNTIIADVLVVANSYASRLTRVSSTIDRTHEQPRCINAALRLLNANIRTLMAATRHPVFSANNRDMMFAGLSETMRSRIGSQSTIEMQLRSKIIKDHVNMSKQSSNSVAPDMSSTPTATTAAAVTVPEQVQKSSGSLMGWLQNKITSPRRGRSRVAPESAPESPNSKGAHHRSRSLQLDAGRARAISASPRSRERSGKSSNKGGVKAKLMVTTGSKLKMVAANTGASLGEVTKVYRATLQTKSGRGRSKTIAHDDQGTPRRITVATPPSRDRSITPNSSISQVGSDTSIIAIERLPVGEAAQRAITIGDHAMSDDEIIRFGVVADTTVTSSPGHSRSYSDSDTFSPDECVDIKAREPIKINTVGSVEQTKQMIIRNRPLYSGKDNKQVDSVISDMLCNTGRKSKADKGALMDPKSTYRFVTLSYEDALSYITTACTSRQLLFVSFKDPDGHTGRNTPSKSGKGWSNKKYPPVIPAHSRYAESYIRTRTNYWGKGEVVSTAVGNILAPDGIEILEFHVETMDHRHSIYKRVGNMFVLTNSSNGLSEYDTMSQVCRDDVVRYRLRADADIKY